MAKPLKQLFKKEHCEEVSNLSANPIFSDISKAFMSRRHFLQAGLAFGAVSAIPMLNQSAVASPSAGLKTQFSKATQLGFQSIDISIADTVVVPAGYDVNVLYRWGDAIGLAGYAPLFKADASNMAQEQAAQAGMHHDGMAYFSLPMYSNHAGHGLLALNHEYVDNGLLFPDGDESWTAEKVLKSQNAMGISVIEVKNTQQSWQQVIPSLYARRITPHTPMTITGQAKGLDLMKTNDDQKGEVVLGTMQNCSNGYTPWGTYLTCEENWSDVFVKKGEKNALEKRYGIVSSDKSYRWAEFDDRFNVDKTPNEPNRFGWVVEIDPYDPNSQPRKHTALGRFKHEGATMVVSPSGQVVVYMGDDQKFEYIYKFISKRKYAPKNRSANMSLLEEGTLYVARFNDDGQGEWLPLIYGKNGLNKDNGFESQGDVLIKTRLAADVLGATKMDRPEWIAANPHQRGSIYCTLTNNNERGALGKASTNAANPRANNRFGHIMHWLEDNGDSTAKHFKWDILVLAGKTDTAIPEFKSSANISFGSPDGLAFDYRGVLWIQTDVSASTININEYEGVGNNQMLATIPGSGDFRRFLVGPKGCEITGIAFAPDNRSMFVNIQHPGEPEEGLSNPHQPAAISSWPDGNQSRPRSATLVITKKDGNVIGS